MDLETHFYISGKWRQNRGYEVDGPKGSQPSQHNQEAAAHFDIGQLILFAMADPTIVGLLVTSPPKATQ